MAVLPYKTRHNPSVFPRAQVSLIKFVVLISIITLTGSGCAFSKYKLAKKDTPPPIQINLNLSHPPIEVLLHNVIIYQGPGSWKRKAYWDEYIISITNQSRLPLSIESATLIDFQDKHNIAGSDPWELEKQSKTWWKNVRSSTLGSVVVLGAGTWALWTTSFSIGAASIWGGSSIMAATAAAGFIAAPVIGVSYIIGSIRGHNKIEKEFDRRHLALPVIIPENQIVQGSLFFPITPGPKCLILNYKLGDEAHDAEFDLSPLKSLHIKEEEDKLPDFPSQESAGKE